MNDLPEWFARLLDDRFASIEKRQSDFVLDTARRLDEIAAATRERLDDIEEAQRHLDKCLDEVKKALPDHEARMKHLERAVFGAAALFFAGTCIWAATTFFAKPYETRRVVPFPTSPYEERAR